MIISVMRKAVIIIIILGVTLDLTAQVQQGYVKTQGRPNRPGKPLSGVTIRWKGSMNAVLSAADGRITSVFPGKKQGDAISLLTVSKKGYELIDPDLIGRQLVFSPNVPIEIVMASSTELEANRKRIVDNAYKKAEERYRSKLDSLERQLKADLLTKEQYRQNLVSLQNQYEKYTSLIENLADRYARTDYDHLDSLDREINICIENGELDRADSLIHTVFDPSTVLERNRVAKSKVEAKLKRAQEFIDKANTDIEQIQQDSIYAKQVMSLCDNLAQEYLKQNKIEKAKKCLLQSLAIRKILYGADSEYVKIVEEQLRNI